MDGLRKLRVDSSEHIKKDRISTEPIGEPTAGIPLDELPSPDSSDQRQADHSLATTTGGSRTTSTERIATPKGVTELDSGSAESHENANTQPAQSGILMAIPELAEQHASDTAGIEDKEHPQAPRVNTLELEEGRSTSPPTDVLAAKQRQQVLATATLTRREKITAAVVPLLYFFILQAWAIMNNSLIYNWMLQADPIVLLSIQLFPNIISYILMWIVVVQPIMEGIAMVYKARRNWPVNKTTTAREQRQE